MTPFGVNEDIKREENLYNDLYSKTRIKIEHAFGRPKGRFRIFEAPLAQRPDLKNFNSDVEKPVFGQEARIIRACLILRINLIDYTDQTDCD